MGDKLDCAFDGMEVIDCKGMRAIPGYIDQHVHITGGGGEGGFTTRTSEITFEEIAEAGQDLHGKSQSALCPFAE